MSVAVEWYIWLGSIRHIFHFRAKGNFYRFLVGTACSSVTVTERITTSKYKMYFCGIHVSERIGAEEAHWVHNPRVGGSKLPFASTRFTMCHTRHRSPLRLYGTPVRYGRHHCGAEEKMVGYLFLRLKSTSVCWKHQISARSSKHLQHFCPLPLPPALDFILQ